MKSFELLRAAATLILEGGWAAGGGDAADAEGNPIDLWVTGSTETGRAAPNPAAVKLSIYGAIVTALHQGGGRLEDPAAMWTLLGKRAAEINNVPHGGDNFVHPLRQFNATQVDPIKVLAFLGRCADELEGVAQAVAMLKSEPFEVRAIPRLTEPAPYPGVALGPHPSQPQPPAMLREVFDSVLAPNAKPLPPALTTRDVQDLHSTLAVPIVKVNRDPGAVAEPMQIARALKAALDAPQAPLTPSPTPPMIEGLKAALGPPIIKLEPDNPAAAEMVRNPVEAEMVRIAQNQPPALPAEPYKPMLIPRKPVTVGQLREEFPKSFYSGPELNMKGMPNPFGGDDEQH